MELRPLVVEDAPELADVLARNREHLAPTSPFRDDSYFTTAGQVEALTAQAERQAAGHTVPYLVLDDGQIVGEITLANIVRGPLLSGNVGYWISADRNGRGLATAAVAAVVPLAFGEHGLHRLEAGTLVDNLGSQQVLLRNGFVQYGLAPRFLRVNGAWRDHVLFQLINEAMD